MEVLKKRGEEEEELHPGQALAQTRPATCKKEEPHQFPLEPVARHRDVDPPAEKGMKASRLQNRPWSSRKWARLNLCGVSHSLSSYRTEVRRGMTVVPCGQTELLKANAASDRRISEAGAEPFR